MSRFLRSTGQVIRIKPTHRAAATGTTATKPELRVWVAFPNSASDEEGAMTWTNIADDVKQISWTRGRKREADRYDPGELSFLLDNRTRRYEPEFSGNISPGNVKPMKRVRVETNMNGTVRNHIVAYVDSWGQQYEKSRQGVCEVSCTDAFKILAGVALPAPFDAAARQIPGLTHWWRLGEPRNDQPAADEVGTLDGTYNIFNQPGTGYPSLVLNEVDPAFNAISNWVEVPSAVFAAPPLTVVGFCAIAALPDINDVSALVSQGKPPQGGVPDGRDEIYLSIEESQNHFSFTVTDGIPSTINSVSSSVVVEPGLVYFVAGRWDGLTGTNLSIRVNGITNYDAATVIPTFQTASRRMGIGTGFDSSVDTGFNGRIDEIMTFNRVLSDVELDALYAAGAIGGTNVQPLTTAIDDILGYMDWPVSMRAYTLGRGVDVPHYKWLAPKGQPGLDLMQSLVETDRGALFMDRNGKLACVAHDELISNPTYAVPQLTFGNNLGAGEVPFSNIEFDYSDQPILNEVRIGNDAYLEGDAELTASSLTMRDTASVNEFLLRTLELETVISTDMNAAAVTEAMLDRANYELDQFKQPKLRITQIELKPMRSPAALWPKILDLELLTRCTVKHTTPTGGVITQNLTIESITHDYDVENSDWTVTLDMSGGGMGTHSYWILGVAGFSELGVTTYLGW